MGRRDLSPSKPQALPMPDEAWRIASVRKQGYRPAGSVIVSYVGETDWQGQHVHCISGKHYDWAWSRDLSIVIAMVPGCDISDALRGCFWPLAPEFLTLIDVENQRVSHVIDLLPKPRLWHLADVSAYFPETAPCR